MFSDHFANPVEFEPAPLPSRCSAYLIDRILLGLFWFLIIFSLHSFGSAVNTNPSMLFHDSKGDSTISKIFQTIAVVLTVFLAYFIIMLPIALFEYFTGGRSPGKIIFGIRIESSNGERPVFIQILMRTLLRDIEGVIGLIFILSTSYRQTLYDTLTGTVVTLVRSKPFVTLNPGSIGQNRFIIPWSYRLQAILWQREYKILQSAETANERVQLYIVKRSVDALLGAVPSMESYFFPHNAKNLKKNKTVLESLSSALDRGGVSWAR